jgi:hypothetical protein
MRADFGWRIKLRSISIQKLSYTRRTAEGGCPHIVFCLGKAKR